MKIYDFTVKDVKMNDVNLADYKDKVLLVVNTATGCGFTPQYEGLQDLYEKYHDNGFEILDFPCNQFGEQTPGSDEEVHDFCTGRYGITFPQYSKIDVNGENAIPLYQWITANTEFQGFEGAARLVLTPVVKKMDKDYKNNGKIKWNFTKILIGRDGEIVARFEPTADIARIRRQLEEII